jgi:hypothetical protein
VVDEKKLSLDVENQHSVPTPQRGAEPGALNQGKDMKFILMMHAPRANGDYQLNDWSPADIKAHMEFMRRFNEELRAAGEAVAAEGLAPPGQARIVRAGKSGTPEVTDGPFPEAKEFLAGYWIVDVETADRAYEIAAAASAAPGPHGAPLNLAIEVRQVMAAPVID